MQMPQENAIADAESKDRSKIIEKQSTTIRKTGLLAGRFRWVICGLLFLGVTKNYMDRQVLGLLKRTAATRTWPERC
jgi:hypothetical protein